MRPDDHREAMLAAVLNGDLGAQRRLVGNLAGGSSLPPIVPPSSPDNGGSGDMGPRLARLEAHLEHVLAELKTMATTPERLARIEEKVSHLPTKDELGNKLRNYLATAGVLFGVVGTAIGLAFKFLGQ